MTPAKLAQLAYDLGTAMAVIVGLPIVAVHPRLRGDLGHRFGRWPVADMPRRPIWFHGASAGDLAALIPLAQRLTQANEQVLLSTWTTAGVRLVRRRFPGQKVFRIPFDLPGVTQRLVRRVDPKLLVTECLELWPNLFRACARQGVPTAIINGRMSARSLQRYRRASAVFRSCFDGVHYVSALTRQYASRFAAAGVRADRIVVENSSKHGWPAYCRGMSQRKLVFASLHRQEARLLLPSLPALLRVFPDLQVVVAPRYPGISRSVSLLLRRLGVPFGRISSGASAGEGGVLLVDEMGGLDDLLARTRLAFVGGSLVERGGHNVVEAARHGASVLVGPHTEHCQTEIDRLRACGAGFVLDRAADFTAVATTLLESAGAQRRADAARRVAQDFAGASDRIAVSLLRLISGEQAAKALSGR